MEPANDETGQVPQPQRLPSSHSHPSKTLSNTSDPDPTPALSQGTNDNNGSAFPLTWNLPPRERPVSGIVPPYWSHHRNTSRVSQASTDGGLAITLEDHTEDPDSDTSRGLWARSVTIEDYAVVQGKTGIGSYVVWNCKIRTLEGGIMTIRMRYSEFDDLREKLIASFPHAKNALPSLPPKSVLFKFRPSFLESRRVGLEYFLNCVLLNPEFSSSPIVKDFLFGRMC